MLRVNDLILWVGVGMLVLVHGDVCPYPPLSGPSGCLGDAISCVNGKCKLQSFTNVTWLVEVCDCVEGWAGPACDVCCDIPCDHGQCKGSSKTNLYCDCDIGYTSQSCNISIEHPDMNCSSNINSTRSPVQCGQIQCHNGNCSSMEWLVVPGITLDQCVCDPGWAGPSCNVCCDLPCDHGVCIPGVSFGTRHPYCACQAGYTGPLCETYIGSSTPTQAPNRPRHNCSATVRNGTDMCIGIICENGLCVRSYRNISGRNITVGRCVCDPGWTGHRCDSCCDLPCGHGVCDIIYENKTMYCHCDKGYTGRLCNETLTLPSPPTPPGSELPIWTWAVISVMILLLLALSLSLLIGLYLLRTRPYRLPKTILRKLHHFSNESDDKEFDAFVSYRSSPDDQHFVVHQLMNKLEGMMNFKICFHARNFLPGNTIAENIIEAVEKSRRTILVISPDYLQGEWPRYEYQVAQQEMLKHKHRIIPIIYKDISSVRDIDPVLKQILRSITYMTWPDHAGSQEETKFWENLKLSMPRKTRRQDTNPEANSLPPSTVVPAM